MSLSRDQAIYAFAAPVVAALIALPVFMRLVTVPEQHSRRQWLVEEPSALPARPLPLDFIGIREGADTFLLPLISSDLPALVQQFDEIAVVLGNEFTNVVLIEAQLGVEGTACRYVTAPLATFPNNQPLWLFRQAGCESEDLKKSARLVLEVRIMAGTGRVAIWTFEDPTSTPRLLYAPPFQGKTLAVRGLVGRKPPATRLSRAQLIAAVWEVTPTTVWINCGLALLALLVGVSLLSVSDSSPGAHWRRLLLAATGMGFSLGGLALATAIIVPPLQAPDEPDHLVTFGAVTGRTELDAEVPALARRTHFERIRHHHAEQFRAEDIDTPWPIAWSAEVVYTEPMAVRSPLTMWWWRVQSGMTANETGAGLLLRLRQSNAILLGVVAALVVLFLGVTLPDHRPALLGFWMLVAPVLPFYAMSMSDAAIILAATLVYAAALVAVVFDTRRTAMVGLVLGVAMIAILLSGRRAWPQLIAGVVVLVVRALSGPPDGRRSQTLWFWTALSISVGIGLWWAASLGMFQSAIDLITFRRPELSALATAAIGRIWIFAAILLALGSIELVGTQLRNNIGRRVPRVVWKWVAAAGVIAIVGPLIASRFIAFPTTNEVSALGTSPVTYVAAVLRSMAVPFRLAHFDLRLSTLFWGGFGWADTVPPQWLIASLCAATAVMLAWTWWRPGWSGQGRGVMLLGGFLGGLVPALAVSALGAYALQYDLYGRYLVGWYVLLIAIAWIIAARTRGLTWLVWAAPALLVHTYCLQLMAIRYF